MPTLASSFYSVSEVNEDIEPYREYRGDVVLQNSTYEFAIGGDIVQADEYNQGPLAPPSAEFAYFISEGEIKMENTEFVARVYEPTKPRVIDDLVDPYNSPMLDGFLQSDFEPAPVVGFITDKGVHMASKPGPKGN